MKIPNPFRRKSARDKARPSRLEAFGAIIQLVKPRALIFVDREYARSQHLSGKGIWSDPALDGQIGQTHLSAPLEAHLQLTNQCSAGCAGCYTGATPQGGPNELGLDEWKQQVDALADMGVFHLALGGGESTTLPWLGELAQYAISRGLVPNLTTSGLEHLDRLLPIAHLFGQINVSIDGLEDSYRKTRGFDGFKQADRAIVALRQIKKEIGINVVVTRHNFDEIEQLFRYAKKRKLNEIELLRFKPSGRGRSVYSSMACSDRQHRDFYPTIKSALKKTRLRVRVDCSYMPMLTHHRPSKKVLSQLAVYGCTGGDFLVGAKATGALTACSFAASPSASPRVDEIGEYWNKNQAFGAFRDWKNASEPCGSCEYLELCRGGCRVVSRHVEGTLSAPDPECPRVVDYFAQTKRKEPAKRHRLSIIG